MDIQTIGQSFSAYSAMSMSSTQGMRDTEPPPAMDVDTIFQNDDANQDGVLSVDETKLTEEMFADADTDSDGQLTTEELEEMLARGPQGMGAMGGAGMMQGPPPGPPDIDALFEQEDTDADGMISAEESALSSDMFANIDADGDGYLTAGEIEESMPAPNEENISQDSSSAQDPNTYLAMAAYQNAVQSFIGLGTEAGDTLTSSLQEIFA